MFILTVALFWPSLVLPHKDNSAYYSKPINPIALRTAKTPRVLAVLSATGLNAPRGHER